MQINTCDVFPIYFYTNHLNKLHNYHDELLYAYHVKVYTYYMKDDIIRNMLSLQINITKDKVREVMCVKLVRESVETQNIPKGNIT